jgi:hypothetical protein
VGPTVTDTSFRGPTSIVTTPDPQPGTGSGSEAVGPTLIGTTFNGPTSIITTT